MKNTFSFNNCLAGVAVALLLLLLFAAVVGFFYFQLLQIRNDSWSHYIGGGSYISNAGSLSPDGEYLVFSTPKSGQGDLWRLRFQDSSLLRLTQSDDFESFPAYSPDGNAIYYTREHEGYQHIWRTDNEGRSHEQLTSGQVVDDLIDVSPNGELLMIQRSFYPAGGGMGRMTGPTMIYSVRDGRILDDRAKLWCRFMDNETVVFHTENGKGYRFGTCKIASNRGTLLGDGFVQALSDNKKYVCVSSGSDFVNRDLSVYNFDTQNTKKIGSGTFPCFFQEDTKLVFFPSPEKKRSYTRWKTKREKQSNFPGTSNGNLRFAAIKSCSD